MNWVYFALATTLAFSPAASAADIPNIVGKWVYETAYSAENGTVSHEKPATLKPSAGGGNLLVVEQQAGNVFAGHLIKLDGNKRYFAGAFTGDEKKVMMSTDFGIMLGEIDGGRFKFCVATTDFTINSVVCANLKKVE